MDNKELILVSTGQDCSTLLLMRYTGLKIHKFFFDHIAVYTKDYIQSFSNIITETNTPNIEVYIKDRFPKLLESYNQIVENLNGPHRVNFHAFVGDKYNKIYIDNIHIDDAELVQNLNISSFYSFLVSLQNNVSKIVVSKIINNINEAKDLLNNYANNKILFFRTLKHKMSDQEIQDLNVLRNITKKLFPYSNVIVITDVECNTKLDKDVIYFKFDHWKKNNEDKQKFLELLKQQRIIL